MADDLFVWIDALFTKARPEGTPPIYVMHRFLASVREFAPACRELQQRVREPELVAHVWRGLLPVAAGAPKLAYAAPKRLPEAERLTLRMMAVLGERRDVVEAMQALVARAGRIEELRMEFGIGAAEAEEVVREVAAPRQGLLRLVQL